MMTFRKNFFDIFLGEEAVKRILSSIQLRAQRQRASIVSKKEKRLRLLEHLAVTRSAETKGAL